MYIIFFGNFNGGNGPAVINRKLKENIDTNTVIYLDDINKFKLLNKWFKYYWRSDVVHISGINGTFSLLSVVLGKILGKKISYTCHGSVIFDDYSNIKSRITEKFYFKFSDKIIMLSNIFSKELEKIYPKSKEKFIIIPNGFEYSNELYNKSNMKDSGINIVSLGGGRANKGNLMVCKALDLIKNKVDFTYKVIGEDGEDTKEIKKYNFVKYEGIISHNEVLEVFSKSQIYIQYSSLESFGIAPLEALNCQCDLIISPNFGVSEVINDIRDKVVFQCDNADELAKVIIEKINCTNKYKSFNHITWRNVKTQYLNLWENLVK